MGSDDGPLLGSGEGLGEGRLEGGKSIVELVVVLACK